MKRLLLILLTFIIGLPLFSQEDSSFKEPLKFKLEGTISDIDTDLPIENAIVKLAGSDSSKTVFQTNSSGFYSFKLQHNVNYEIEVTVSGFITGKATETTHNLKESTKYIHDFKLQWNSHIELNFFSFYYEHNQTTPIFVEKQSFSVYEMYYNRYLKAYSNAIFEVKGSRYPTENDSISLIRAEMMVSKLVEMGIDSNRLIVKDKGVTLDSLSNATIFQYAHKFYDPPTRIYTLEGTITDVNTHEPIENATVILIGTDASKIETKTDSLGFYSFELKPETSYIITIQADHYLSSKGQETTVAIKESTKFIHDFKIQLVQKCTMPFTQIIFAQNSFKGSKTSDQNIPTDSLAYTINTLKTDPNLVFGITGYRDINEKTNISYKRAKWVKSYVVNQGINKKRLKIIDGGIREDKIPKRIVQFSVIASNFNP